MGSGGLNSYRAHYLPLTRRTTARPPTHTLPRSLHATWPTLNVLLFRRHHSGCSGASLGASQTHAGGAGDLTRGPAATLAGELMPGSSYSLEKGEEPVCTLAETARKHPGPKPSEGAAPSRKRPRPQGPRTQLAPRRPCAYVTSAHPPPPTPPATPVRTLSRTLPSRRPPRPSGLSGHACGGN